MMNRDAEYQTCIDVSEKVAWKLSDIFAGDDKLDFTKQFFPESLSGTRQISCLSSQERLLLNQLRGFSYTHIFQFCEEYIIAQTMQHAQAEVFGSETVLRAMLRFAEEEVKHQQMFKHLCDLFLRDFGVPCGMIANPEAVAGVILSKTPMAVLLTTAHFELESQQHYVEGIRDNMKEEFDPIFKKMLALHWVEESQHVKLDVLELKKLKEEATPAQIDKAIDDYLDILTACEALLRQQALMDVDSLERRCGRQFTTQDREEILDVQIRACLKTWLTLGLENQSFIKILQDFSPAGYQRWREKLMALPSL